MSGHGFSSCSKSVEFNVMSPSKTQSTMKKLFTLLMVALLGFASCSKGASTPGEAAKTVTDLTIKGDYKAVVDMIYFKDVKPEELENTKEMMVGLLTMAASELEKQGGVKKFEVLSETISEDGKTAVVEAETTYGNGTVDKEKNEFVLVDGKWMIDMGK